MDKLNVAVLFGGNSPEHEISKLSAKTIINGLSTEKYVVIPVYISKTGQWFLYDGSLNNILDIDIERVGTKAILSPDTGHRGLLRIVNEKVKVIPIDVVIPALHGQTGEDGAMQGLFQLSKIPYVGCDILSSAISMDKYFTKVLAKSFGINIGNFQQVKIFDYYENKEKVAKDILKKFDLPIYVKPANGGSSIGISKVSTEDELDEALVKAFEIDAKVIIEETIVGREIECAVIGIDNQVTTSPIGEIKATTDFYDFDSKYNDDKTETLLPKDIPDEKIEEVQLLAKKIFTSFECTGLSRIDFFLENETNKIYFNEINTFPGFTSISMYPVLMEQLGMSLPTLIDSLIEIAMVESKDEL